MTAVDWTIVLNRIYEPREHLSLPTVSWHRLLSTKVSFRAYFWLALNRLSYQFLILDDRPYSLRAFGKWGERHDYYSAGFYYFFLSLSASNSVILIPYVPTDILGRKWSSERTVGIPDGIHGATYSRSSGDQCMWTLGYASKICGFWLFALLPLHRKTSLTITRCG